MMANLVDADVYHVIRVPVSYLCRTRRTFKSFEELSQYMAI